MSLTGETLASAPTDAARAMEQPAFIRVFDDAHVDALRVRAGDGPLSGMTFAVKDNIDVAGVPTTAACPTLTTPAAADATAVRRLLDAGAVPVGKTNMDQFATGLVGTRSPFGACHSVASTHHVSGGSSSGSAVAVAAGVVPLALGTDTAGSGRVPAAFNGIVGMKPTRGLISTRGVLPACRSLDCVTTFTRDVALAAAAFDVLVGHDPADPYSRAEPPTLPSGVARTMSVIGIPFGSLDLDDTHREAWELALLHAAAVARLVPVDVSPFLEAATLLYGGAFVAERTEAFGELLEPDGSHLDPVVRRIVLGGAQARATDVFTALHRLADLRPQAMAAFAGIDALLLPVTPGHPTLAEVAADPISVNARLGTYTNMVNLLDLCAVALPAGARSDGLPFGVQLLAPAFADRPLLDLAARWEVGRRLPPLECRDGRDLLVVAGAHLSGQPKDRELVELGGRLHRRSHTAPRYRMYAVPGPFPRPALVASERGAAIEVEVWDLPFGATDSLRPQIAPPLSLGPVELDDGSTVTGFLGDPACADAAADITDHGSWRAYLKARPEQAG